MRFGDLLATWRSYYSFQPQFNPHLTLARACCKSPFCSGARMPTSANCPKNPSDVRADVGIRAPILPLSQQPLTKDQVAGESPVGGPIGSVDEGIRHSEKR